MANVLGKFGFTIPPSGFVARALTRALIVLVGWAVLWSIIGQDVLPGGNIFGIFVVVVFASLGGFLVQLVPYLSLPSLLGMLIVGFMLRNVPGIDAARHIDKYWSATLRSIALVVILTLSGLELDPVALRRLKFTVIRLAFGPCICEGLTVAVVSRFILDMPWLWGLQLGFVLAAVSPAVVVPQLLVLQQKGFGVEQGIPTLVMAASSCDDVLAISLFSVFLGVAFSAGNLVFNILRGPLELVMGLAVGLLVGLICWFLPHKSEESRSQNRFVVLLGCALLSLFGSNAAHFPGAGALGIITMAIVAAHRWGDTEKVPIVRGVAVLWEFFQPLLFGLIGAEVSVEYMDSQLLGKCLAVFAISVTVRLLVTYVVVLGNNLTVKEKIFVAISWLPKATVQAAIGSVALDTARRRGFAGQRQEELGIQILTMAVLSILLTAPIGGVAIALSGPRMLRQAAHPEGDGDNQEALMVAAGDADDGRDVESKLQMNTTV